MVDICITSGKNIKRFQSYAAKMLLILFSLNIMHGVKVLFFAHHLIMVYICNKFCENILNGLRVMERTHFQCYRKNSKNWNTLNYQRDCPTNGIVGFYSAILRSTYADRITNRVDTDQTAPRGAV